MDSLRFSFVNRNPLAVASLQWLQWITIGVLFSFFYGPLIPGLVKDWYENSTFSYGFLIPFIAAYLVWQRRVELKSIPICASLRGVFPLLLAVIIGLVGRAVGDTFTMRVSMILALGSSLYSFLGKSFFKALLFPVFYLVLMIPVPYALTKEIAYHLRFLDASLAANALQLFGIPVYREAYFLHLPDITLEVADMCAGLASIFALFALGAFYVCFLPLTGRVKTLLVLSTLPIAVFSNLLRIVAVAVLAYFIGPAALEMTFHRFSGTTTFLSALILLVLLGELLRKKYHQDLTQKDLVARPGALEHNGEPLNNWSSFVAGVAIFMSGIFLSGLLEGGRPAALSVSGLQALPVSVGSFRVIQAAWDDPYKDPKADISVSRIYWGDEQKTIELFVGYRGSQNGGERISSPKLILPEHWNFEWIKPALLEKGNGAFIQGNWMLTRSASTARLVLYWYDVGGKTIAGELRYRIEQTRRSILERRSDGAAVRLATPVAQDESVEQAQQRLLNFSSALYPELVRLLPQ